ncbi:MAG: methyltransferase domain-containing protein [Xanthobacteraceae bacterium]|nr:methyltransferase domain-containing protein [Xanthobacteraceae bacterium]
MPDAPATPVLFDRGLLRARLSRAEKLGPATFLLDHAADEAAERLAAVNRDFASGIDLATPGAALRATLDARGQRLRPVAIADVDREPLPLAPNSIDLAVSLLALQFVNDLPGVLAQVRRALRPDGLLLAAMIGGDTLTELRQCFAAAEAEVEGGASPHVSPFADLRDAGGLLQRAGFALPVTDVERLLVRYDNAFALMRDLRRMGATNVLTERRKGMMRRATLLRMAQIYGERFSDADGRIRATFDIVWLLGWSPHPDQPKPLRPGSAKLSLEDAVKRRGK